jgi:hypothetical protein
MTERFPLGEELERTALLYELGAKSSRNRVEKVVANFGLDLTRQPFVKVFPANGLLFGLTNQRLWLYETDKKRKKLRPVVGIELNVLDVDWTSHPGSGQVSILFTGPSGRFLACESEKFAAGTARKFARRVRKAVSASAAVPASPGAAAPASAA